MSLFAGARKALIKPRPSWVPDRAVLVADFADGGQILARYWLGNKAVAFGAMASGFTRNSVGYATDNTSVVQKAVNTPKISKLGLAYEPAATNLIFPSVPGTVSTSNVVSTWWRAAAVTWTAANAVGPDGIANSAGTCVMPAGSAGANQLLWRYATSTPSQPVAAAPWVKGTAGERVYLYHDIGTGIRQRLITFTGQWQRIHLNGYIESVIRYMFFSANDLQAKAYHLPAVTFNIGKSIGVASSSVVPTDIDTTSAAVTSAADAMTLGLSNGNYTLKYILAGMQEDSYGYVASQKVPDANNYPAGEGFTITGLAVDPDGTLWAGSDGRIKNGSTYNCAVIHLSADGATKLGEINYKSLFSSATSIQGVAYDTAAGTLWVTNLGENLIRQINKTTGAEISTVALAYTPNGLAYDAALDRLVVGRGSGEATDTVVEWLNKSSGAVIKSLTLANNPDHLFIDSIKGTAGWLYYTWGNNGNPGRVYVIDIATGAEVAADLYSEVDAIEGIIVEGEVMRIANDSYFHGGAYSNSIVKYTSGLTTKTASITASGGYAVPTNLGRRFIRRIEAYKA